MTYTFNLSYEDAIVSDNSKIVVRFPPDFVDQFDVTECVAMQGFNTASLAAGNKLDYIYDKTVRILTIYLSDAPSSSTTRIINFTVSGVTNPRLAIITG